MRRRVINLAVFLAALAVLAVAVNGIAARPGLRWRVDATKTRAYSLSDQTRRLLADLAGEWTIAVIMSEQTADRALRRQVDEVLQRYDDASEHVTVVRIDPARPSSLDSYEALLARLRHAYRDRIAAYEDGLAEGRAELDGMTVFLQQQAGGLAALRGTLDGEPRRQVDQLLAITNLRLEQARQVGVELEKAMRVDESRPLPDYELARSVLAAAMSGWADELYQINRLFAEWRDDAATDLTARRYAAGRRDAYDARARTLAATADELGRLPELELARIGRSLEAGDTAVVLGPAGAAVIPPQQLFARLNLRSGASGTVTFDQRFRGEQAISATIRSLVFGQMPVVFLVHAQGESMLSRRPQNVDLMGAADMLGASRIDVREWIVPSARPGPPADRPVVWVVVPPPVPQRRSLAMEAAEQALVDATRELIADGESVLLSLAPSATVQSGRADPWPLLLGPFGLDADTARVVFETVTDQAGSTVNQRVHQRTEYVGEHPIASAAHGLQTSFDLPVPIAISDAGVRQDVLAVIEPAANRWLEPDWMVSPQTLDEPTSEQRFDEPLPLVVAAERANPVGAGRQRLLVVGSGGWLLSYLADVVVPVGGERMILVNPGNYELLLAGVTWLAGADELIAASPVSRQTARLDGVTGAVRTLWRIVALVVLPLGTMLLGIGVWAVRRA